MGVTSSAAARAYLTRSLTRAGRARRACVCPGASGLGHRDRPAMATAAPGWDECRMPYSLFALGSSRHQRRQREQRATRNTNSEQTRSEKVRGVPGFVDSICSVVRSTMHKIQDTENRRRPHRNTADTTGRFPSTRPPAPAPPLRPTNRTTPPEARSHLTPGHTTHAQTTVPGRALTQPGMSMSRCCAYSRCRHATRRSIALMLLCTRVRSHRIQDVANARRGHNAGHDGCQGGHALRHALRHSHQKACTVG